MKLTLGFSPCPNDTYILAAIVNGWIDTQGLEFDFIIEDIADLNKMSEQNPLDISKISYYNYALRHEQYRLLDSGSALGQNCGPLLIYKDDQWLKKDLSGAKVAIPGVSTTANMLLSFAHPEITNKHIFLFSDIEKAVLNGEVDLGLIIHENRFTYALKGLKKRLDLGEYWESTTQSMIPLGGFVIQNKYGMDLQKQVEELIRKSIDFSDNNWDVVLPYIKSLSQEMEEHVIKQHINLYVNEFSKSLGIDGLKSIKQLFHNLAQRNFIKSVPFEFQ